MPEEAIRLQKYLSSAGVASRRESERLISEGLISVNGKKAKLGQKVIAGKDVVKYQGEVINEPEKIIFLFNKPRGYLCNNDGREREEKENIYQAFPEIKSFPVIIGLEKQASGLILLGNDGDLHQQITSKYRLIRRVFHVRVKGEIDEKTLGRLVKGMKIDDQRCFVESIKITKKESERTWYKLSCLDHKDKMLEKLFKTIQHPIQRINQIEFAGIHDENLLKGKGRILSIKELNILKQELGIT